MPSRIRYLLLQIRDATDPMRNQEIECFSRTLPCEVGQIEVHDLLTGEPSQATLDAATIVLLGGSGDYSAAGEGAWLERALDALRRLHELAKPTFASCWGFQAMARAMGGEVIHDVVHARVVPYRIGIVTGAGLIFVITNLDWQWNWRAGIVTRVFECQ